MWTKPSLIYAGRSSGKTQMSDDTFLKTRELVGIPDEPAAGETGTDDNDIGRNVPSFEIRYPNNERLVAFAPAGPGFAFP